MEKYVSLFDIYDENDLYQENELLSDMINPEEERNYIYKIEKIQPNDIKKLKTSDGETNIIDAYNDFSKKEQKEIVKHKMRLFDKDRIIVLSSGVIIDGNHHAIAAYKLKKPIFVIDIQKPIDKEKNKLATELIKISKFLISEGVIS